MALATVPHRDLFNKNIFSDFVFTYTLRSDEQKTLETDTFTLNRFSL